MCRVFGLFWSRSLPNFWLTPVVFSTYVPSGDSKGLLEALKAASPKKSPKKPTASGSTRPRKSLKHSTKGRSGNETVDESTQETDTQTKAKKSTSRKSTKAADSSEKVTGGTARDTTPWIFGCAYSRRMCSRTGRKGGFDGVYEQGQGKYR